jgi:hypothetical protein
LPNTRLFRELVGVRPHLVGDRGQARREAHEHEAAPDLLLDLGQAVVVGIHAGVAGAQGHADEAPVGRVGPGVIRAGDALAAIALLAVDQPGRAVAADVMEAAHAPVGPPDRQDRLVKELEGQEIAHGRHVVDVADQVPALAEHDLALELEELGVPVGPAGQAEVVFRAKIGGGEAVGLNTCIHC